MKLVIETTTLLLLLTTAEGFVPTVSNNRILRLDTIASSSAFGCRQPSPSGGVTSSSCWMSSSDEGEQGEEEIVPSLENSVIPPPSTPQPKPLDPLVKSLTRMDEETANAPTMKIPLWGELVMDKSLFVLLPVATFAIVGFAFSVYVGLTSADEWVAAIPAESSRPVTTEQVKNDNDGCRGLCSQQEKDLESLRNFMNKLSN